MRFDKIFDLTGELYLHIYIIYTSKYIIFIYIYIFILFNTLPLTILVLPPGSSDSDPGSHSGLFSTLPTALHFCHDNELAYSCLVGSGRILPAHTLLGALNI